VISIFHLGDITKLNGHEVPIVDVITGGSPCQDLSVAGRRAGLAGERSGLFMEQVRLVKEQRAESEKQLIAKYGENFDRTKIKPRYMVWENVCFTADTLIDCENGQKKIIDVKVGDRVKTHLGRYMPVVETYVHTDKEVITVHHSGQGESFTCTPNHPIYGCRVNPAGKYGNPEFIPAGSLDSMCRIAQFSDDKIEYTTVTGIEFHYEKETVYNLSVLEDNTYVANSVVCHNCGAFSSGDPAGSDFAAVLEEITRVVVAEVPTISVPEQGWPYSGCLEGVGDDGTPFSICYRTHDAQHFGVPQRRRRIALVADFRGNSASEILFERESLSGNTEQSSQEGQAITATTSGSSGESSGEESSEVKAIYNHPQGSELSFIDEDVSQTLTARAGTDGNNTPMVYENHGQDTRYTELGDICTTVSATFGMGGNNTPFVVEEPNGTVAIEGNGTRDSHKGDGYAETETMYTLNTVEQHAVAYGVSGNGGGDTRISSEVHGTLTTGGGEPGQGYPCVLQTGTDSVTYGIDQQGGKGQANYTENVAPTLAADSHGTPHAVCVNNSDSKEPILLESNQNHATIQTDGIATTLPASMGEGGGYVPMVVDDQPVKQEGCDLYNLKITGEVSPTISTVTGNPDGTGGKVLMTSESLAYGVEPGAASRLGGHVTEEVAPTLRAEMGDNQTAVVYGMSSYDSNAMKSDNPNSGIYEADTARTLDLNGGNPACNQGGMMVVQGKSAKESVTSYGVSSDPLTSDEKQQVEDWVDGVNASAKHQQDLIQSDLGVARTLAPGTHASGPHLTKTLVTSAETNEKCLNSWDIQSKHIQPEDGKAEALCSAECRYGGAESYVLQSQAPACYGFQGQAGASAGMAIGEDVSPTMVSNQVTNVTQPTTYQKTTGALMASGYDKLGTQEAANDMYVVQESAAWDGSQISSTFTANNANGAQRMPDKENFNAVVQSVELFHCTTEDDKVAPLMARDYKDPQCVAIDMGGGKSGCGISEEQTPTLTTTHGGEPAVCNTEVANSEIYGVSGTSSKFAVGENTSPTQTAAHPNMVSTTSVVRRLTPLECERLQGFPDFWTNIGDWTDSKGKKHKGDSDSPRYKALGNSIALPFWSWMAKRMVAQLHQEGVENPKMASLFDGIGGFPLVYSWYGCEPVWASEIEEFPIAVTSVRFSDDMWKQYVGHPMNYPIRYNDPTVKANCSVGDNVWGTLSARDYKGVGNQDIEEGKVIF